MIRLGLYYLFDIFPLLDVILLLLPCDVVLLVAADDVVGMLGPKVEVTFGFVLPVVGGFWSWAKAISDTIDSTNTTLNKARIDIAINAFFLLPMWIYL